MINLSFSLLNPFGKDKWDSIFAKHGMLSKNKGWELEVARSNTIIDATLRISFRQSHAGILIAAGLFGTEITFNIYDTRHWNYKEGRWESGE